MPYSRNRPPAPIDKGKQGGGSRDASDITEYNKMKTIVDTNSTKIGFNNRNLVTHTSEIIRSTLLWRREIQPINTSIANASLSADVISSLSGLTFFIFDALDRTPGASGSRPFSVQLKSDNRLYYERWSSSSTPPNSVSGYPNLVTSGSVSFGDLSFFNLGLRALPTFPAGTTRQTVVMALNTILNARPFTYPGESSQTRIVATLTSDGKLKLSISGPQVTTSSNPQTYTGIFFGDGPSGTGNASTSLGVTNENGVCGVDGAALLIPGGQSSVTASYQIAAPGIDFSTPPGGC